MDSKKETGALLAASAVILGAAFGVDANDRATQAPTAPIGAQVGEPPVALRPPLPRAPISALTETLPVHPDPVETPPEPAAKPAPLPPGKPSHPTHARTPRRY